MSDAAILPAPTIDLPPADAKWWREYRAFLDMGPELREAHRGRYVAVHEGKVVGSGTDKVAVALRAYEEFGYVPIYVGLVSDAPGPPARMPSPRLGRGAGPS